MTLAAGTLLGPYEILARIGAGGMGEVFRARDSRMGRDVAVKVVPESFASNPDRVRRFEQEARTAGSLNHPNLVTVHDFGTHGGAPYLVMELLEGESLRERLESGRIPMRKAIEYAMQIAHGLATAHEKGIIHRDLKPENVFVTRDGRVKILDFGLAKLGVTGGDDKTDAMTHRRDDTAPGTVLGTLGYMSPEQVRGQQVDQRTDIFSFGAILYEMLSGRRAFRGATAADTMSAVLNEDPAEVSASGQHVSPSLDRIVRRCLEKDREQRFQSARDLAFALDAVSNTSAPSAAIAAMPAKRRVPSALLFAALALIVAGAAYFLGRGMSTTSQPRLRQLTFRRGTIQTARFAPDGQTIIYGAAWEGSPFKLFQRRLDGPEAVPIDLPDADVLSVSKKGELAISMNRQFDSWLNTGSLARAPLLGGSPRKMLDRAEWADWTPEGDALVVVRRVGAEDRLECPLGNVLYRTQGYIAFPRVAPDGTRIAFLDHPFYGDDRGNVSIIDRDGKNKRDLVVDWAALEGLAWKPDGDEIWFSGQRASGSLHMYAVDLKGKTRTVWEVPGQAIVQDIAADGRVLVAADTYRGAITVHPRGGPEREFSWFGYTSIGGMSPDGSAMLLSNYGGDAGGLYETYLATFDGKPPTRLGDGDAFGFSPDGRYALAMIPSTPARLVVYGVATEETRKVDTGNLNVQSAWWFGTERLLIVAVKPGGSEVWIQNVNDARREKLPLTATFDEVLLPSPDATKIALFRRGDEKTSVVSWDGHAIRPVASVAGEPHRWSADSRSLLVSKAIPNGLHVDRVDVATGAITPVRDVVPTDRTGTASTMYLRINNDGEVYAYGVMKLLSDLYVVEGLK
ncbi:MAG TPA: protein kinase [Thermoanaerobaculia bacterium]|nr:protein kinase [Thermoanaerobaculia bacterium]